MIKIILAHEFDLLCRYLQREMAQLDAADSMPGNWLGLGLINNNLKVKLLKVGLASSCTRPLTKTFSR